MLHFNTYLNNWAFSYLGCHDFPYNIALGIYGYKLMAMKRIYKLKQDIIIFRIYFFQHLTIELMHLLTQLHCNISFRVWVNFYHYQLTFWAENKCVVLNIARTHLLELFSMFLSHRKIYNNLEAALQKVKV